MTFENENVTWATTKYGEEYIKSGTYDIDDEKISFNFEDIKKEFQYPYNMNEDGDIVLDNGNWYTENRLNDAMQGTWKGEASTNESSTNNFVSSNFWLQFDGNMVTSKCVVKSYLSVFANQAPSFSGTGTYTIKDGQIEIDYKTGTGIRNYYVGISNGEIFLSDSKDGTSWYTKTTESIPEDTIEYNPY